MVPCLRAFSPDLILLSLALPLADASDAPGAAPVVDESDLYWATQQVPRPARRAPRAARRYGVCGRARPAHCSAPCIVAARCSTTGSAGCGSADAAARAAGQMMEVAAVCCQSRVVVIQERGMGGMAPAATLASEEEGAVEDSGERAALAVLRALSGF